MESPPQEGKDIIPPHRKAGVSWDIFMKSPLPFLSLALLAQFSACNIASSSEFSKLNVTRAGTTATMLVLAGQANKGYKYSATDGSYTIKFPGKPTESTQTVQTKVGPIKAVIVGYEANQGKRGYAVSSTQYKVDPRQYNVQKGLDGARDGMAKNLNATVSNETKINYKGAAGKQFYLTLKQGKGKVRVYIVNGAKGPTIYQAFVMDTTGKVDDAEVNSFLDSLTFKSR